MKILYYVYGLNVGGAETYIYNVLQKIDAKEYHIDFVIQEEKNKNINILNWCEKNKARIYRIPKFFKKPFRSYKALKKILQSGKYDAIHVHCNSLLNFSPIMCAKSMNIPLIVHSHSTSSSRGIIGNFFHYIIRDIMMDNVIRVACGEKAGKWMFGNRDFLILNNGIIVDKYTFSSKKKDKIRKQYNIPFDKKIIGHIGRFVPEKNQKFIIDIVSKLNKIDNKYVLMLVGEGPLKDNCMEYGKNALSNENIIFTGNVSNPEDYYSAFDCMLFPSLYEGIPFTLVEAQAAGLPVVASNNITKEIQITNSIEFLSLDESIESWMNHIVSAVKDDSDRIKNGARMKKTNFDIEIALERLTSIYDEIAIGVCDN